MTAFDLIDSIFSRVQRGVPGHMRRISQAQFDYLESLIGADPEGSAYKPYAPNQKVWAPAGRHKYILTQESPAAFRSITKLSSLNASGMGRLF